MNIVYISMLSGKKSAGLSYSIPAQIESQRKFDNVFWYNINQTPKDKIINGDKCYSISDYPTLKICDLPSPFNKPDLVIFEGVYIFKYIAISKECKSDKIPYIVIPRSSLTKYGQKKSPFKKIVGNLLFFKKFINKASAIQYLTDKEFEDSGEDWNKNHLVIPNGVKPKEKVKEFSDNHEIRGSFIGRSDSYQKGIDLLLDACSILKKELEESNCKINIFAPLTAEDRDNIQDMITKRGLDRLVEKHGGIFGDEKEKILLDSDFFILTSRFEGHPMGLIEALSYGLPCLVTEGTNMAREIKEENAGWSADITVDSIVHAFKSMLSEKALFKEKGQNALELSRIYNWDSLAMTSHDKYQEVIKFNRK